MKIYVLTFFDRLGTFSSFFSTPAPPPSMRGKFGRHHGGRVPLWGKYASRLGSKLIKTTSQGPLGIVFRHWCKFSKNIFFRCFTTFFVIFRWFFIILVDFGEARTWLLPLGSPCDYFLKCGPKIVIGPTSRGSISELRRSWKENSVSRIAYVTSTIAWANFWDDPSKLK